MSALRACALSELADGAALRVVLDGHAVALVRLGDRVHAVDDRCSHADVSLAAGEVDAGECALECWKHGSLFDLRTGEALTLPAVKPVTVHMAAIEEDQIYVTLQGEES